MYYPLSQITPNLHTNGEEYAIATTGKAYTGYYWKTSQGNLFTGRNPQDVPTQKLIPITKPLPESQNNTAIYTDIILDTQENVSYYNVKIKNYQQAQIPQYSPNIPTENDYQIGEYRRYFCKKSNELIYLEISKDTHDKIRGKNSSIAYQYYIPFNIPWQLTGDKEQVYTTNRNIVALAMKQQKLPMFDIYLQKDYIKYYR